MSKNNGFITQLKNGIFDNNPTLIQLLGLCPALAITTSLSNAIGMGVATTAVLICSNILISLLRKFIPSKVRIYTFVIIISGLVTALEMLMKSFFFELYASLGLFVPLIAVNCIILEGADAFASKNRVIPSAIDGLAMGLGFTVALIVISVIRELLGSGTILGFSVFGEAYRPATLFILPSGAFLTLGIIVAALQKARYTKEDKEKLAKAEDEEEESV